MRTRQGRVATQPTTNPRRDIDCKPPLSWQCTMPEFKEAEKNAKFSNAVAVRNIVCAFDEDSPQLIPPSVLKHDVVGGNAHGSRVTLEIFTNFNTGYIGNQRRILVVPFDNESAKQNPATQMGPRLVYEKMCEHI